MKNSRDLQQILNNSSDPMTFKSDHNCLNFVMCFELEFKIVPTVAAFKTTINHF